MRSAEQAHLSIIRHSPAHLLMVRTVMAVVSTAVLLLLWHPSVIRAQGVPAAEQQPPQKPAPKAAPAKDTASVTHVVKAGETLWSIATRYYGDGHQWRAVARRNGIELSGGTGISVGRTLVIPSRKTVVASASTLPASTDTTTPRAATTPAGPPKPAPVTTPGMEKKPAATSGTLAAQTAPKSAAPQAAAPKAEAPKSEAPKADVPQANSDKLFVREASHISVVSNSDMRAARTKNEVPTVFLLHTASASDAIAAAQTIARSQQPVPRTAELFAAPFVIAESQWASMGRVMKRIDGTIPDSPQPGRMHLADRVDITPPAGSHLAVGDRLLAVRPAGLVNEHVSVVMPTGVLQVTDVGTGPLVRVYVRSLTGPLEEGQAILPISATLPPAGVVPTPSTGTDIETSITWTEKGELLPTVESYAVIAAGEGEGVKAGDLFELVRATEQGAEERLAIARVLRVGPLGSTVILTKQWRAGIKPGVKARRVARMP